MPSVPCSQSIVGMKYAKVAIRSTTTSHNKTSGTYFRISSTPLALWLPSDSTRGQGRGLFAWFSSHLKRRNNRETAHPSKVLITCSTLVGVATDKTGIRLQPKSARGQVAPQEPQRPAPL